MVSDEICTKRSLPTGSCFMAGQTCTNIQGCALSLVVLALTKETSFEPWKFGNARLSELPVEQWFSSLRSQSSNSQLSCRAFYQASARVLMKHGKLLDNIKAEPIQGTPPLSEAEFLATNIKTFRVLSKGLSVRISTEYLFL